MTDTIQPAPKLYEAIPVAVARAKNGEQEYLELFLDSRVVVALADDVNADSGDVLLALKIGNALAQAGALLRLGVGGFSFVVAELERADALAVAAGLY